MKNMYWLFPVLALWVSPLSVFAGDSDDDGIPNKYDLCKSDPEDMDNFEDTDGCPEPDNDKDGVCDPWVMEKGQSAKFASVCKGSDKCGDKAEDRDGYQDDDGCPDEDNDGDGIPDKKDRCPKDKEDPDGFEDNDGCPDVDNDKDGVPDAEDKCPSSLEDKDGFEDVDGCPDLDNDKDGIPDDKDKCPNQAENKNNVEDEDGCVDKTYPALQPVHTFPLARFRTGTPEMTVEAETALEQFSKRLADYQDSIMEVRVFTWYKGKKIEDYLRLLQERSKAVVDFLVSKGVKPAQLKEVNYTVENMEAVKGTDADFNQEKPLELRLQN